MYLPKHFSVDQDAALKLTESFPFATLISTDDSGAPYVNHVPLLMERGTDGTIQLVGHVARRNPQWSHFRRDPKALAIFHGPHAYITPKWYKSGRDVPTWNYGVVQVSGVVRLVEDFEGLTQILKKLTRRFEEADPNPWEFELPADLMDPAALTGAIVGFEIAVEKIDAKFKLSQNRSAEDQKGVIQGLESREDEMSRLTRQMMTEAGGNRK